MVNSRKDMEPRYQAKQETGSEMAVLDRLCAILTTALLFSAVALTESQAGSSPAVSDSPPIADISAVPAPAL